jgi:hypothetical protein
MFLLWCLVFLYFGISVFRYFGIPLYRSLIILDFPDNPCRHSAHYGLAWYIFCNDGTCRYDSMAADGNAGQYDGIGTNPYVVANDDGAGAYPLLVYTAHSVLKVMVQRRHRDALCQVDVVTYADGTNDGAVDADARMVANGDIAHGIVDAAERLNDAAPAQPETAVGWRVHAYAVVYLRAAAAMLVEWGQQPDVPAGTGVALVHDEVVKPSFQLWRVAQPGA